MSKRPDISIKLVLRAEGRILMLHHENGTWEFPGGRLEWGETPETALTRELNEELQYAAPGTPIFINMYNYIAKDGSRHSVILHYFLAVPKMPQLQTTSNEPDAEVVWLTKAELQNVIPNPEFIAEIYRQP